MRTLGRCDVGYNDTYIFFYLKQNMAEDQAPNGKKSSSASEQLSSSAQDVFSWWKKRTFINPEDSFWTITSKVLFQVFGIVVMLIASPMLLLALVISFLVAL